MSKQKVRLKPVDIDDDNWYYEGPRHITLVHRVYSDGSYIQTDQFEIPWKRLLESVKRKYPET